jgi:hypothetical protein
MIRTGVMFDGRIWTNAIYLGRYGDLNKIARMFAISSCLLLTRQFPNTDPVDHSSCINTRKANLLRVQSRPLHKPLSNLEMAGQGYIMSLPIELQQHIFSYLVKPLSRCKGNGMPQTDRDHQRYLTIREVKDELIQHPFLNLAATSRSMRNAVESYCAHLIQQNRKRLKFAAFSQGLDWSDWVAKTPADVLRRDNRKIKCARMAWIRAFWKQCMFCQCRTARKAVMDMLYWCCLPCDNKHYGEKIVSVDCVAMVPRAYLITL